jgi:hypothetical protein
VLSNLPLVTYDGLEAISARCRADRHDFKGKLGCCRKWPQPYAFRNDRLYRPVLHHVAEVNLRGHMVDCGRFLKFKFKPIDFQQEGFFLPGCHEEWCSIHPQLPHSIERVWRDGVGYTGRPKPSVEVS